MKSLVSVTGIVFLWMVLGLSSCAVQDDKAMKPAAPPAPVAKAEVKAPPAEKAPEKAKATKVVGDVGLLDLEKNYMILVTKDGKLVTLDFDAKTKATQIDPTPAKIADVGPWFFCRGAVHKRGRQECRDESRIQGGKGWRLFDA